MNRLKAFIGSRYLLWVLLAIPGWRYVSELASPDRFYPEVMEASGILSVQVLVFTLCITPLSLLLKHSKTGKIIARWLLKNRRYFGLAGFIYASLHTALYVRQTFDFDLIWLEAFTWALGTGWISLLVMLPIALTSNNFSISKMGKSWVWLQRSSYVAIIAGLVHWLLLDFFFNDVLVWIVILTAAKIIQICFRAYGVGRTIGKRNTPIFD